MRKIWIAVSLLTASAFAQFPPSGGGSGASGAVTVTNPVAVQGIDPGLVLQTLKVDASGNLLVAGSTASADCALTYSVTAAATSGTSTDLDNRTNSAATTSCRYWVLVWNHPNTTSTTVNLQTAADVGGTPGVYATSGLTPVNGSQTSTEAVGYGAAVLSGYTPWLRLTYTAAGATTLEAKLFGFRTPPAELLSTVPQASLSTPDCSFTTTFTGAGAATDLFSADYSNAPQSAADRRGCTFWRIVMLPNTSAALMAALTLEGRTLAGTTSVNGFYRLDGGGVPSLIGTHATSRYQDVAVVPNVTATSNGVGMLRVRTRGGTGIVYQIRVDGWRTAPVPVTYNSTANEWRYAAATSTADTAVAAVAVTTQDIVSATAAAANGQSLVTGVPTAASFAATTLSGTQTTRIQVTGTWTGNLQVETSMDNGANWTPTVVSQTGTTAPASSFTQNFIASLTTIGATDVRVRSTAVMTGSASVAFVKSSGAVPDKLPISNNKVQVSVPVDGVASAINITTQDAVVVTSAGANGQPFFTNGPPTVNSFAQVALIGNQTTMVQAKGTWSGTLQVETSIDSGVTWTRAVVVQADSTATSSSFTQNFIGQVNTVGATNLRIRAVAAMTGTAIVSLVPSYQPGPQVLPILGGKLQVSGASAPANIPSATINISAQDAVAVTTTGVNGQTYTIGVPTAGSAAAFVLASAASVQVNMVTGGFAGTLLSEISFDGGGTWFPAPVLQEGTSIGSSAFTTTGTEDQITGKVNTAGATHYRIRCTSFTAANAAVSIVESPTAGVVSINNLPKSALNRVQVETAPVPDALLSTSNITARDVVSVTAAGANGQSFVTGVPTAASFATATLNNIPSVVVQASNAWTGSLQAEITYDGTIWIPVAVSQTDTVAPSTLFTQNFAGTVDTQGAVGVRIRETAVHTGTAQVALYARYTTAKDKMPIVGGKVQVNTASAADTTAGPVVLTVDDSGTTSGTLANGKTFTNGSLATAGSEALFTLASVPLVKLQTTGNMIGTAVAEVSFDGGVRFYRADILQPEVVKPFSAWTGAVGTQMNLVGTVNTQGATHLRVRVTTFTSGTLSVTVVKTAGPSSVSISNLPQNTVTSRVQVDAQNPPDTSTSAAITAQDIVSVSTAGANGQSLITGVPTVASFVQATLTSNQTARIQVTGIWTGTLQVETSIDGGTTWVPTAVSQTNTTAPATSFIANFVGAVSVNGATHIRVRSTAVMTGTANVVLLATYSPLQEKLPISGGVLQVNTAAAADTTAGPITLTVNDATVVTTTLANGQQTFAGVPDAGSAAVFPLSSVSAIRVTAVQVGVSAISSEISFDGGLTYTPASVQQNGVAYNATSFVSPVANENSFVGVVSTLGATHYRIRLLSWTSGTVGVSIIKTVGVNDVSVNNLPKSPLTNRLLVDTVGPQDQVNSISISTQDIVSVQSVGANGQLFITGAPTALSAAAISLVSVPSVHVLVKGTWTGTVRLEVSADNGTTWTPAVVSQTEMVAPGTSFTQNFQGTVSTVGMTNVRVRSTAVMTGTANVVITKSYVTVSEKLPILGGLVQVSSSSSQPVPDCSITYTFTGTGAPVASAFYDNKSQSVSDVRGCMFWRMILPGVNTAGSHATFIEAANAAGTVSSSGVYELHTAAGFGGVNLSGTLVSPGYRDFAIQPSVLGFGANQLRVNSTGPIGAVYTVRLDGWRQAHVPVEWNLASGQFKYAAHDQYASSKADGSGTRPISNQQNTLYTANEALCRDTWNPGVGGGTPWSYDQTIDKNTGIATPSGQPASMRGCRYWQVSIPAQASATSDALTSTITVEESNDAVTWRPTTTYKFNAWNRFFSFVTDAPYLRASVAADPSLATWTGYIEIGGYRNVPPSKEITVTTTGVTVVGGNLLAKDGSADAVDLQQTGVGYAVRSLRIGVTGSGVTGGSYVFQGSNNGTDYYTLSVRDEEFGFVALQPVVANNTAKFFVVNTPYRFVKMRVNSAITGGLLTVTTLYSGDHIPDALVSSTNLLGINNIAPSVNYGVSDAGTLRTVLANRGQALTSITAITTQDAGSTAVAVANGQIVVTGTPTALSFHDLGGLSQVNAAYIQVTNTFTGTLAVEGTFDNAYWTRLPLHQMGVTTAASTFTSPFSGLVSTSGMIRIRVRSIAPMTGQADVQFATMPDGVLKAVLNAVKVQDGLKVDQNDAATPFTVQQSDGINSLTLVPPSTSTDGTETSVPVSLSPNGQGGTASQPLFAVQGSYANGSAGAVISAADVASVTTSTGFGQTLITGTPTANSSASLIVPPGSPSMSFRLSNAGPFVASLVVEGRQGGTAWIRIPVQVSGATGGEVLTYGPFTGPVIGTINTVGLVDVRLRATSYTSGSVNLSWFTSPSQGQGPIAVANPEVRDASGRTEIINAPTSLAANALLPVASPAITSSIALKTSAGNLYSLHVTVGATAGYLMLFNSTTAPADGPVTPVHCVVAPANQTTSLSHQTYPAHFSTGIVAVFSTTGCFTQTASASVFFGGQVK
jgi:hypothetical protein